MLAVQRLDFRVLGPIGKDLSNGPFAEVDGALRKFRQNRSFPILFKASGKEIWIYLKFLSVSYVQQSVSRIYFMLFKGSMMGIESPVWL